MARALILWLDDTRPPEPLPEAPDAMVYWVKNVREAIESLEHTDFDWVSLDHDLGEVATRHHKERTGYDIVLWMIEHNRWPKQGVIIHSWNPVASKRMCDTIDRYGPYSTKTRLRPAIGLP